MPTVNASGDHTYTQRELDDLIFMERRIGAAQEREACARIAESLGDEQDDEGQAFYVALKIAADIRARSTNSN